MSTNTFRVRDTYLDFSPPAIGEEEIAAVVETLRSGWLTTGPKVRRFEEAFAQYLGVPHAVAVNSCTAALELALAAAGIGPGDEVLVPTLTFCSTANVVIHRGARPVLCDICPDDGTLDPLEIERRATAKTRAVIPVHFAGHPCRMSELLELAEQRRLFVLDDAAHAVDAHDRGQRIGTLADATAFSFYATKNLTTGEGGMLTTRDGALAERARVLALHGMSRDAWQRYTASGSWYYEVVAPGFKINMTDLAAALGLVQLAKLPAMQARRAAIAAAYSAAMADLPLITPQVRPHVRHGWHLYVIRLRREALRIDRAQFIAELRARQVGASVHFIPVHLHPYYRDTWGYRRGDLPHAEAFYDTCVSLPLHPGLSEADVAYICEAVHDVVRQYRR
jgi:dTDP-4-amino-4,6-dideoxygalactose transaminase